MEKEKSSTVEEHDEIPLVSLYATCTCCGRQLGKYEPPCRTHTTVCPKCGAELSISAESGKLHIALLATKQLRHPVGL